MSYNRESRIYSNTSQGSGTTTIEGHTVSTNILDGATTVPTTPTVKNHVDAVALTAKNYTDAQLLAANAYADAKTHIELTTDINSPAGKALEVVAAKAYIDAMNQAAIQHANDLDSLQDAKFTGIISTTTGLLDQKILDANNSQTAYIDSANAIQDTALATSVTNLTNLINTQIHLELTTNIDDIAGKALDVTAIKAAILQVESDAKNHADNLSASQTIALDATLAQANAYADSLDHSKTPLTTDINAVAGSAIDVTAAKTYIDAQDTTQKNYTDSSIGTLTTYINTQDTAQQAYTDSAIATTNSTVATNLQSAKDYADAQDIATQFNGGTVANSTTFNSTITANNKVYVKDGIEFTDGQGNLVLVEDASNGAHIRLINGVAINYTVLAVKDSGYNTLFGVRAGQKLTTTTPEIYVNTRAGGDGGDKVLTSTSLVYTKNDPAWTKTDLVQIVRGKEVILLSTPAFTVDMPKINNASTASNEFHFGDSFKIYNGAKAGRDVTFKWHPDQAIYAENTWDRLINANFVLLSGQSAKFTAIDFSGFTTPSTAAGWFVTIEGTKNTT